MKKTLQGSILSVLCCMPCLSQGQTSNSNKSVKLYTTFDFFANEPDQQNFNPIVVDDYSRVSYASPAFQWQVASGDFFEFELTNYRIRSYKNKIMSDPDSFGRSTIIGGSRTKTAQFGMRYEYNFSLIRPSRDAKIRPFIGLGANPYFSSLSNAPMTTISFPVSQSTLGIRLIAVPRIQYTLNEKWYLDLNIPVTLIDANSTWNRVENPNFTTEQQRTNTLAYELLPSSLQVRLGIGYTINAAD